MGTGIAVFGCNETYGPLEEDRWGVLSSGAGKFLLVHERNDVVDLGEIDRSQWFTRYERKPVARLHCMFVPLMQYRCDCWAIKVRLRGQSQQRIGGSGMQPIPLGGGILYRRWANPEPNTIPKGIFSGLT